MPTTSSHEVTGLLLAWNEGDQAALDRLIPLVHAELRRIARRFMRNERAGHTLQPSALINEAYMRMIDAEHVQWQNRAHFFGFAAQLMRRVLVDFARSRNYKKRGGGAHQVSLDKAMVTFKERGEDLVALDEALRALSEFDERKGRVVEMRFFGGLSEKEIAEALTVSQETVGRDWRLSKSWLRRRLTEGRPNE
jgi:RNA polymerase sigma-70 factor (ECF subfamily)